MHQDNLSWQNELSFMQQEIDYFQNCLTEISQHDPSGELGEKVNDFRKHFATKLEMIQALQKSIGIHQHYLAYFKRNRLHAARVVKPDPKHNHHQLSEISHRYQDLKKKVKDFISKNLYFKSAPNREI